ncbi:hypothetical protein HNQ04_000738 [Deinococcus radiopugnans ATCC 19172]|uniref:Uncharacterized protein n=1 Tax=Deinococcus radiopugnans ATCC 19172 TaxID=585398 RepID=A0ABR6NNA6_9DEIO|nr:hypothetical protein [Deinococcus radiopugnans ATCC 19172]
MNSRAHPAPNPSLPNPDPQVRRAPQPDAHILDWFTFHRFPTPNP